MFLLVLTRPDNSAVAVNPAEIQQITPVPQGGGSAGPSTTGTRILFNNGSHQDVTELFEDVLEELQSSLA